MLPKPGNQVLPWNVHGPKPENFPLDCQYFGRVFAQVDLKMAGGSLDFLMTWNLDQIPMQGENVVVFLIGDEMSQWPNYAGRVKAIFKTGGIKPFCPIHLGSPIYSTLEIMRTTRNRLTQWKRWWRNRPGSPAGGANVFPIPLGYFAQADLPMVPIARRKWDIFFAGISGKPHWNDPLTWPISPRVYSRNRLGQMVARLLEKNPTIACNYVTVPNSTQRLSPAEYSARLADSKICLVPRGNIHETYRFLEAARAGCILISEPVQDVWYYEGHPAVVVPDWNRLEKVVGSILSSPDRVMELHQQSIAWWQKKTCEAAVAEYLVQTIQSLDQRPERVAPRRTQLTGSLRR